MSAYEDIGGAPSKPPVAAPSRGTLPRDEWVEAFEGWGDCDNCRAPVVVVRENAARHWNNDAERTIAQTRHRLYYACEECGHAASQLVAARFIRESNPRRWDVGAPGEWAAYNALASEVKTWHDLGLVETRKSMSGHPRQMTAMSAEVWIAAGCPATWSPVWDEINKGYPAACYEGRLVEYCNDWRARLESARAKRTRSAA